MSSSTQGSPIVVVYGCLSKRGDDDESIPSQIDAVKKRLAQVHPDGYEVVGDDHFEDNGMSGSKRNRGPGLQAAIDAAVAAADERGRCEMWANTSARFARGTGKKDEARSLLELFTAMRRAGVTLRSVHDDEFLTNEMLIGFASAQASKYADDLSESVSRAKRRDAAKGKHLGGPLALGYMRDDQGSIQIDPAHAPTVERIFELAVQGVPDSLAARTVNAEGFRTRRGIPFDRRAIQNIVCNGFYSGRIAYAGDLFDGQHVALVGAAVFDRIQSQRAQRDLGDGQHQRGAPARKHLLSRLADCGACGSPMFAYTSPYRRVDGTKARQYRCRGYHFADGTCSMKVDAEAIDTAVMERLHRLIPDFERWSEQIEDRHAAERERLEGQRDRAHRERDDQARKVEAMEDRWAALSDQDQSLVLGALRRARRPTGSCGNPPAGDRGRPGVGPAGHSSRPAARLRFEAA